MGPPRRVGIFGGSFDPPHIGHLLVAQDAAEALSLDRLVVVPAATQPLKGLARTPAVHRLAMAERCFEGIAGVTVDPIEIHRGGLSYMVETAEAFGRRWPSAVLHLLVGEDVVATLPRWREPMRLLSMVQLVVLRRPEWSTAGRSTAAEDDAGEELASAIRGAPRLATRHVEVSSTEVRKRVDAGLSIRGFVTASVEAYIMESGLYCRAPSMNDAAGRA